MNHWQLMGRIISMRSYQVVLLVAATLAVFGFYYLGSEKENFSSTTRRIKESRASQSTILDMDLALSSSELKLSEGKSKNLENRGVQDYHLLMMFTKVHSNPELRDKFQVALRSLVRYGKFENNEVLSLHFVADEPSKEIGKAVMRDLLQGASFKYKVPVRTTSRSPVLSRRDSPLQGSVQQNSQTGQRNSTSNIEPRLLWERVEKLVPRPGSGSSSGSSNSGSQAGSHPGSQSGSGERFREDEPRDLPPLFPAGAPLPG
ncbi:xyloside xylosyltransferase 1 [Pelobates cultripes]|uniref:Xyloside xylosyltransferase 1 n=1 Tax=Pelobates cultripes TaxID=61616 RepID=A0AAD1VU37_PELCU|nr:xyloside xylosyltransferase 1 [Pelobates cultripes]